MDVRFRHARRRVAGRIGALIAAVLVIPGLTLAPAHAALSGASLPLDTVLSPLDPVLDPVEPVLDPVLSRVLVDPDLSGAGSVTGVGGLLNCVNATSGTVSCGDPLTLADLGGTVTGVLLTADPADGWEFAGWSGGCTGALPTCQLSADALNDALAGTPLAPVAAFVPVDGSGEPNPLCEASGGEAPGIDCDPPVTVLKTKPTVKETSRSADGAGVTRATSATFTFAAMEPKEDGSASTTPTPGATFACRLLKKPATSGAFAACPGSSGTATYNNLTDGTYEFAVQATDAEDNTDLTPETFTWTVDTAAPETVLTSRTKFWVLGRKATFGLDVVAPDVKADMSFQCYLDGAGRDCFSAVRFGSGSHVFSAAATDKAGNEDATPVTHTFTMPVNNTALNHSKGWTKAKVRGTFLNTASITKKKGAKVATKATGIKRIALVASKGKGHGVVKVMLGKKTLKKVNLAQKRDVKKKVVQIARFSTPVSGKVTVQVVSQGKKVVVEGLGIATG